MHFQSKSKGEVKSLSRVRLFATLWTVAHQVPLSMGFSRQEYWSGLPCPPPGDCPDLGIKLESLTSPALAGKFFNTSATWKAHHNTVTCFYSYSHFMEDVTETY